MNTPKKNLKASEVIDLLIQGNARFINGLRSIDTFLTVMNKRVLAQEGQFPFCTLVTCSDSRIPIELIFDRGLGDLFVTRSFGNAINSHIVASIEYSVLHFDIEVVVVMGHSRSGAIRMTMEMENNQTVPESPHFQAIIEKIRPSLNSARVKENYFGKLERTGEGKELWERIYQATCQEYVRDCCHQIQSQSLILSERVKKGTLFIIPALYDIAAGKITFELPPALAKKLDPKVVELEAFRHGKTAREILEQSVKAGQDDPADPDGKPEDPK